MNVVGHYYVCVQIVVVQSISTFHDGLCYQPGDFWLRHMEWAGAGVV